MSMLVHRGTGQGRHTLRAAWIWVASLPVAFVLAMVTGEGLISALGYESGGDTAVPLGPALVAGVPAMLLVVVPALLAYRAGMKARREGDERGTVPATIGGVVGAMFLVTNLLGLVVGR